MQNSDCLKIKKNEIYLYVFDSAVQKICFSTESKTDLPFYRVHGFFAGTALAVWRLLRCNPFCMGGIDKVPPKIIFANKKSKSMEKK